MEIRYIKRNDINTSKWDSCISHSVNGIAYAYSWFLDIVADEWDALVGDDYLAVFPLIGNRKYGIDYIFQPYYTKQLGLFAVGAINSQLLTQFIELIPDRYRYISITVNTFIKVNYAQARVQPRTTYHLDLIEPYPILANRYSTQTKNSISLSIAKGVTVVKGLSAFQILELKKSNSTTTLKEKHFSLLNKIITNAVSNGSGILFGAYTNHNELCAAIFLLNSNGKTIYFLSATNDYGRSVRATYAIIDHFIHINSEKKLVLDFEGSSDANVNSFYVGFGAQACTYQHLTINKLPWYLKLFR